MVAFCISTFSSQSKGHSTFNSIGKEIEVRPVGIFVLVLILLSIKAQILTERKWKLNSTYILNSTSCHSNTISTSQRLFPV